MNYPAIVNRFQGSVWAILPDKLDEIAAFIHAKAFSLDVGAVVDPESDPGAGMVERYGSVGVLNIMGTIMQRVGMLDRASGGVSSERIAREFDGLMADPAISSVLLNIDSPGGSVHGLPELTDRIFKARGTKPIVALANPLAASAAYFIGSAADEFYVTPSGEVGSIGTVGVHLDTSEADKAEGRKYTIISAGKYKAEGNPHEPLSDDSRAYLQGMVDHHYGVFVNAVARNRGISAAQVKSGYGEGRVLVAPDAKAAGMVDGIRTVEQVLGKMNSRGRSTSVARKRMALTGG